MPAPFLLQTEVPVVEGDLDVIAKTWLDAHKQHPAGQRLYRAVNAPLLLELAPLPDLDSLGQAVEDTEQTLSSVAHAVQGDLRRQLHRFVESPKPVGDGLPNTSYIQLRRVEVRPSRHAAYREWRERTIFNVVRRSPAVTTLLAYHSYVADFPGVLFVTGFEDPQQHDASFSTPEYHDILRQARAEYITESGGDAGLHTRTFALIPSGRASQ